MNRHLRRKAGLLARYFIVSIIALIFLMPVIWLFLTSIKNQRDAFSIPPVWKFKPSAENYLALFAEGNFPRYLWNSFYIAAVSSILAGLLGTPLAYMLARFRFKGKDTLSFWVLASRIAPPMTVVLPFFMIFKFLGILNTYMSMICVYMTLNIAFVVWMMRGYFMQIPLSIEEAAKIDGCSVIGTLLKIAIPLVSQGLAATLVFCFMSNWSEFVLALIFTGMKTRTMPILISGFVTTEGVKWGLIGAAGTIVNLPVILISLVLQKYLVSGLTAGAVK
ncbi:MAG: carbohydrate ABC transporter permease [Spirochaetes bacterium]|nr:carbohydrate ABC transporter permease [Spirochaetota bacterium]